MRKLFGLVAGIAFAATVSAQINVGANFLVGLPSGDWHKAGDESIINTAFGGGIEGNYFVTEDIAVGLEVGYLAFGEKDDFGLTFTAIPITIKGEYYFLDDEFRPFVGLGIGYNLVTGKVTIPALPPLIPEETTTETTFNGLAISPRVGAIYQVSDLIGIVLNINYNLMFGQKADGEGDVIDNATNWVGIGLGVRFTVAD
jgi:outer membrane protein W